MSVRLLPDAISAATAQAQVANIPRLPPAHVARPRLADALLAADCRLRLICAPAGFGKTVLMSECARRMPADTTLVWLDLSGRFFSPQELYAQLAAALGFPIMDGDVQRQLIALLGQVRQPLWIMLDDYPREVCPALDACLDMLLEQTADSVSWWVNSRRQPAWNLPRLLLQGHLFELDAASLALTAEELAQVLRAYRLQLPADSFQQLLAGTEGWPAGVCHWV